MIWIFEEGTMSTKEKVIDWIRALPDDCTLEDVQYHLHVREKVGQGMEALEQGQVVSHEEAKRRMAEWLALHGQPQR
jgi:predicted transcriptional regulator